MNLCLFPFWIVVLVAPVAIWLLFRSGGYKRKPLDAPPREVDWTFTGERFVDPNSGELLEVWQRAPSGQRVYVRARPGELRR